MIDLDELVKLANQKFAEVASWEMYEMHPTDAIEQHLLTHADRFLVFYNVTPPHEVTMPATRTVDKDGVITFNPEYVVKYKAVKSPFMWAARIYGHWFICELGKDARMIDHNMWLSVFNKWSNPGYTMLARGGAGWYLAANIDPRGL